MICYTKHWLSFLIKPTRLCIWSLLTVDLETDCVKAEIKMNVIRYCVAYEGQTCVFILLFFSFCLCIQQRKDTCFGYLEQVPIFNQKMNTTIFDEVIRISKFHSQCVCVCVCDHESRTYDSVPFIRNSSLHRFHSVIFFVLHFTKKGQN